MQIEFERSGGFAGMRFTASIAVDSLDDQVAAELRQLVDAADFFNLPPHIPRAGADMFQYTVSIEDADRQHTVIVEDAHASEPLHALLNYLTRLARSRKR